MHDRVVDEVRGRSAPASASQLAVGRARRVQGHRTPLGPRSEQGRRRANQRFQSTGPARRRRRVREEDAFDESFSRSSARRRSVFLGSPRPSAGSRRRRMDARGLRARGSRRPEGLLPCGGAGFADDGAPHRQGRPRRWRPLPTKRRSSQPGSARCQNHRDRPSTSAGHRRFTRRTLPLRGDRPATPAPEGCLGAHEYRRRSL
jgi:hypothetical protein